MLLLKRVADLLRMWILAAVIGFTGSMMLMALLGQELF
jgi:hypothetical protein